MGNGSPKAAWDVAPRPTKSEQRLKLIPEVPPLAPEAKSDLLATIHERIIPQLVMAHCADVAAELSCPDSRPPPTAEEVSAFSAIAVREDIAAALAFVEVLAGQGVSLEAVLLHLVAPAARLLGEEWLEDLRSFTEVTLGLGTLHQVVHILGPNFAPDVGDRGFVLMVAAPCEQHTLGMYLAAEFLRRAGWGVQVDPNMPQDELLAVVRAQSVEMVGISVSKLELLRPLATLITCIRSASRNPDIAVMIGGASALQSEAEQMGAAFCSDARDAVRWLEQHVRSRQNSCTS